MTFDEFSVALCDYYKYDLDQRSDEIIVNTIKNALRQYSADWGKAFGRITAECNFKPKLAEILPIVQGCVNKVNYTYEPRTFCPECADAGQIHYHAADCPTLKHIAKPDWIDRLIPLAYSGKRPGKCFECGIYCKPCARCEAKRPAYVPPTESEKKAAQKYVAKSYGGK